MCIYTYMYMYMYIYIYTYIYIHLSRSVSRHVGSRCLSIDEDAGVNHPRLELITGFQPALRDESNGKCLQTIR